MIRASSSIAAALVCLLSAPAWPQDAQQILQTMQEKLNERRAGVQSFIIDQTTMGQRTLTMYERTSVSVGGQTVDAFRVVPPAEIEQRRAGNGPRLTPSQLEVFAQAQQDTGDALKSEMERGMAESGLPTGLLGTIGAGTADTPWVSPDPSIMFGANAEFLRAAADAERNADDGSADAQQGLQGMAEFARQAKLVGSDAIDGNAAFHLRADKLNRREPIEGGGEFVLDAISLWVDKGAHVPLRLAMTGRMTVDGQTRDIQIEKLDTNYRPVPGSSMYEPYRSIMKMGGVLTDKEKKELEKAQVELEKMQKQLDAMPASQRAMVERMMGPQMEMIKNMAANGGLEVITEINEIRVDAGLPGQDEIAEALTGGDQ